MESVYWVITLRCNDYCDHCYNHSGPNGEVIDTEALLKVIPNLPKNPGRIILSGGEPTIEMEKLLAVIRGIKAHYQGRVPVWLQSNGDLINEPKLRSLLEAGLNHYSVASDDRYHINQGKHLTRLKGLFEKLGMLDQQGHKPEEILAQGKPTFSTMGANAELWLGGNWARGRALDHGLSLKDPQHNFCAIWSGAIGFLDDDTDQQEIHIQLTRLYPCCPTTLYALGDVREHSVEELLDKARQRETYQTLNKGDVYALGTEAGLSREYIQQRIESLGDVCLWCDEYFEKHYPHREDLGEKRKSPAPPPKKRKRAPSSSLP